VTFFLQIIKEEEYLKNKVSELKIKNKDSILGTNVGAYKFRKCCSPRINSLKMSKAMYLQTSTVLLVKCQWYWTHSAPTVQPSVGVCFCWDLSCYWKFEKVSITRYCSNFSRTDCNMRVSIVFQISVGSCFVMMCLEGFFFFFGYLPLQFDVFYL